MSEVLKRYLRINKICKGLLYDIFSISFMLIILLFGFYKFYELGVNPYLILITSPFFIWGFFLILPLKSLKGLFLPSLSNETIFYKILFTQFALKNFEKHLKQLKPELIKEEHTLKKLKAVYLGMIPLYDKIGTNVGNELRKIYREYYLNEEERKKLKSVLEELKKKIEEMINKIGTADKEKLLEEALTVSLASNQIAKQLESPVFSIGGMHITKTKNKNGDNSEYYIFIPAFKRKRWYLITNEFEDTLIHEILHNYISGHPDYYDSLVKNLTEKIKTDLDNHIKKHRFFIYKNYYKLLIKTLIKSCLKNR